MKNTKRLWAIALIAAISVGITLCAVTAKGAPAQQSGVLLSGSVKSDAGANLDGVTVSARAVGQTITTSVLPMKTAITISPAWLQGNTGSGPRRKDSKLGKPKSV
jgi:hypothetical protein